MRTLDVELDGRVIRVELEQLEGESYSVRLDGGEPQQLSAQRVDGMLRVRRGGEQLAFGARVDGSRVHLQRQGYSWAVEARDPRRAALLEAVGGGAGELRTEMPGAVVRVPVSEGEHVREGQVIVVVEAMKMENEFKAPMDGVVDSIAVQPGDTVESGALLARVIEEGDS